MKIIFFFIPLPPLTNITIQWLNVLICKNMSWYILIHIGYILNSNLFLKNKNIDQCYSITTSASMFEEC